MMKELEDRNSELAATLQQESHKSHQQEQYINELVCLFFLTQGGKWGQRFLFSQCIIQCEN